MSDEQFKKFYRPSLKAVNLGLIEKAVCAAVREGGYNSRLEYLKELPPQSNLDVRRTTSSRPRGIGDRSASPSTCGDLQLPERRTK